MSQYTDPPGRILNRSRLFFYTPSQLAVKSLFYLHHLGDVYCDSTYIVERDRFDSYLVMYLLDGKMMVKTSGGRKVAEAGDLIFIDCYLPHMYKSLSQTIHFYYIHLDGLSSKDFYTQFSQEYGNVFTPDEHQKQTMSTAENLFNLMMSATGSTLPDEHRLSVYIHMLLNYLVSFRSEKALKTKEMVNETIDYISSHLTEEITVQQLADLNHLDVSYFSRVFKSHTHSSPIRYINARRIDRAKMLLATSKLSTEQIAEQTGFKNLTTFYRTFKNITGTTPRAFEAF
ncbi:MAG: helix-turn-helix transcriptional regulator [Eubacterium sp.]|nr:helix-turn-helix transcriptional regulator [Eubacterium sp.]